MGMETQAQALAITKEDELLIARGARAVHFRTWRKLSGLTLEQVSRALAKDGINIPVAVLSLFERGGTDRKGIFVATIRGHNIDFRPEVLSKLEELYNVPVDKRLENRDSYERAVKEQAVQQVMQPILGGVLGRHPISEVSQLKFQIQVLTSQLEKEQKIVETLLQQFDGMGEGMRNFVWNARHVLGPRK